MAASSFGESISPAPSSAIGEWVRESCSGDPWTVGALVPNGFEVVVRLVATTPGTKDWWLAYKEQFVALISVCVAHSTSRSALNFGIWEGHGFCAESTDHALSKIPKLEMPNRNYFLLTGDVDSVGDLKYPGSADWRNPDLVWPDDHSWFIATDVDFWSLYVGGSSQMIQDIESRFGDSCERVGDSDKLVIED